MLTLRSDLKLPGVFQDYPIAEQEVDGKYLYFVMNSTTRGVHGQILPVEKEQDWMCCLAFDGGKQSFLQPLVVDNDKNKT